MPDRLGDKVRLQHILDAITEIETYTKVATFEEFISNSMMYNATLRQLEIIGEASTRLSDELKASSAEIPWRSIIRLRNLVIHEYFGVDNFTIWSIIKTNLPLLKPEINIIMEGLD